MAFEYIGQRTSFFRRETGSELRTDISGLDYVVQATALSLKPIPTAFSVRTTIPVNVDKPYIIRLYLNEDKPSREQKFHQCPNLHSRVLDTHFRIVGALSEGRIPNVVEIARYFDSSA